MTVSGTTENTAKPRLAVRITACIMAALLITCFQVTPFTDAYAAKAKSESASNASSSSKNNSNSLKTPDKKSTTKDEDKDKDKDEQEEEEEESEEEKQRREEAEEKRATADSLYAQADAAESSLNEAEDDYDDAVEALENATIRRDEAKAEYQAMLDEVADLQENLSEYVVDMYKQGGSTPYLDVMLGATSYREFLTSWNMTNTVSEYGHNLVVEKKEVRAAAESNLAESEKTVKEAERTKALADSNRRLINATMLALRVQAAQTSVEAAELEDDEEAMEEAQEEAEAAQEELDEALEEGVAGESLLSGTGYFTHPCPDSTISSGFGYRSFDNAVHKGIDFAAPEGTPYYAADSGTVTAATNGGGDNGGAGNWIVINHGNGLVTKYMHSLVTFVTPGDHVERGQNIGLVGNTGQSTGPHLHFQIEANGVAVNPVGYL